MYTEYTYSILNIQTVYQIYQITKMPYDTPSGRNILQIALKHTHIFHSKALQNIPTLEFLV
jgi:hypothetical protein